MESEPIWYKYATFDDDGFVNGISDDAPEEAKQAYAESMAYTEGFEESNKPIPR